jgi:hypothetical protein
VRQHALQAINSAHETSAHGGPAQTQASYCALEPADLADVVTTPVWHFSTPIGARWGTLYTLSGCWAFLILLGFIAGRMENRPPGERRTCEKFHMAGRAGIDGRLSFTDNLGKE